MSSKKPWHLDRRTFLRGVGVACALPYLEAMGKTKVENLGTVPKRLCFIYTPNGVGLPYKNSEYKDWNWFPYEKGPNYKFTKTLSPLAPYRKDISILGGLSHPKSRSVLGHIAGDTWLTGGDLVGDYKNSISVDQYAAKHFTPYTRYPSLILSTDGGIGYKSRCSTLSFDALGEPIPSEHRQRDIFERYFTTGGSNIDRRKSIQRGKKIVDQVLQDSKRLMNLLGANDKAKLDEYLTSLNQVEQQVIRNEKWLDVPMKNFDASLLKLDAAPTSPEEYLRSTLDLIVLAFQTDITRVVSYMVAREDAMGFGENFPKLALGLSQGHHGLSHGKAKGHWEQWGKYDQWLIKQFTYFIDKMKNTHDEYGSLLDNTLVLYGSSCSNTHNARNYPLILAGGAKLGAKHGTHTIFDERHVHMSNLFVAMLNAVGIKTDTFADSTKDQSISSVLS